MKKSLKRGGLSLIVTVVILTSIVMALILVGVIPSAQESVEIGTKGVDRLNTLEGNML